MSGYLLDTNVLSEQVRGRPEANVVRFLKELGSDDAYISVVTVHELVYGAHLVRDARQSDQLMRWVVGIETLYAKNVLPVDGEVAHRSAVLRSESVIQGRTVHLADGFLAGTALVYGLTLATRNTRDFEHLGLRLLNPWMLDNR